MDMVIQNSYLIYGSKKNLPVKTKLQNNMQDLNFLMSTVLTNILKEAWQALFFMLLIKLVKLEKWNYLNPTIQNITTAVSCVILFM